MRREYLYSCGAPSAIRAGRAGWLQTGVLRRTFACYPTRTPSPARRPPTPFPTPPWRTLPYTRMPILGHGIDIGETARMPQLVVGRPTASNVLDRFFHAAAEQRYLRAITPIATSRHLLGSIRREGGRCLGEVPRDRHARGGIPVRTSRSSTRARGAPTDDA